MGNRSIGLTRGTAQNDCAKGLPDAQAITKPWDLLSENFAARLLSSATGHTVGVCPTRQDIAATRGQKSEAVVIYAEPIVFLPLAQMTSITVNSRRSPCRRSLPGLFLLYDGRFLRLSR